MVPPTPEKERPADKYDENQRSSIGADSMGFASVNLLSI